MKNQEIELTEGLFTIEAEERLETIQMATDIVDSCCFDGNTLPEKIEIDVNPV